VTILRHKPREDEQLLLPATVHAPAARHLNGDDRDRSIAFDDVDDTFRMPLDWQPARGADKLNHAATRSAVDELMHNAFGHNIPASARLRSVPLVPVPVVASINDNTEAIRAAAPNVLRDGSTLAADLLGLALAGTIAMLNEPDSWPPIAYDLARSVTTSNQLAVRPTPDRFDLRDIDGYLGVAEHENAIASIQMDIYADRADRAEDVTA
jgi:hypothetical protein